ncbi:NAD(P)H-dependent flavin oxidoreductase [Psychrobacillus lasiicapitis]|uniref:Probable nitronate monooxygenase n=1 Tax=Psychrobacillus lasiicapitis TaxID=1636719 RepID=A0A544T8V7_9BACI|nr:nitronate monooxygenase [Psychrobacillus lasiicapitis]TQR13891.1 nitronate monooxygenase [Psychrobacillus lasiicapitis]GGA36314.1 putative nitronate monooxygenase [Psychrobacillus lasiicapitis]
MLTNLLTNLLKINYPIIQAPMAGGITTSNLVAAVSNNGALGMIGAGYLSPAQLQKQIREIKELTSNSFGVNLFVPNDFQVKEDEVDIASNLLHQFRAQLNIENDQSVIPEKDGALKAYNEQIEIVIEEKVPICSFTFGVPSIEIISQLKQHGIILIGTATTVVEAMAIEELGMDAVVVQGSEAGGHRGNFISSHEESLVGLMSLIPQVADQVSIPVIAAGGIMDGRGLLASISLGAQAVQMGTAFLTCEESGAHPVHKEAILQAKDEDTIFTRAFSGKWARGIQNKFITEMQEHEAEILPFPVQNTFTQSIRKASSSQNNKDFMSLWSGQSPTLAKNETVEMLIQRIIKHAEKG